MPRKSSVDRTLRITVISVISLPNLPCPKKFEIFDDALPLSPSQPSSDTKYEVRP